MNSKRQNVPLFAKAMLILITGMIIFSGCKDSFDTLNGRVYLYKDSVYEFTAAFEEDTLFYIMKDARMPMFHKTTFKNDKINDSTYKLTLKEKPKFWEKDTWEIVVLDGNKFKSRESGNVYLLYSDSMIVRKAPEFQK